MSKAISIILLVALISVLTACSIFWAPDSQGTEETAPSENTPVPTEPVPRRGGELRVPLTNPDTFNPLLTQSRDMLNFLSLIYESPIAYDENLRPVPSLVTGWEVSPDGRLWVFDVRKDVLWHNGETMTGEDILFTFQILQSGALDSFYQSNIFENTNIVEYGLRSGDPHTFYIRLGEPSYQLLDLLTFPVLPKSVYQSAEFIMDSKDDPALMPVGTGPYRIDPSHSFDEGTIRLTRNERWWNGAPYIDSILARTYQTNDEARNAFEKEEIDLVDTTVVYANTRLNRINAGHYKYLTSNYEFLALNSRNPLFEDKNVRKAMAYAINRKDIISKVYLNNAETVDVPIPSDSWLYNSSYRIYDFDEKRAARLLEEAGWKDTDGDAVLDREIEGEKIDLAFTLLTNKDNAFRRDTAYLIAEQLSLLGFHVQVELVPWDVLQEEKMAEGEFDAVLTGYSLDNMPDLRVLFHSAQTGGNGSGFLYYNNPEMDYLLNLAAVTYMEEERKEVYEEIQKLFVDELPVISLYFRTGSLLADNRVHGIGRIGELGIYRNIEDWFLVP
ncbi:MAG: ABC transporter substrate-binding protein [Caldicoprobacterales bacterium]|jgi:peptide/nickel transport system substrate-binding protein